MAVGFHQTERDAIIVPAILRLLPFRALMAVTQIVGYRKPLAAWLGVIAVMLSFVLAIVACVVFIARR